MLASALTVVVFLDVSKVMLSSWLQRLVLCHFYWLLNMCRLRIEGDWLESESV